MSEVKRFLLTGLVVLALVPSVVAQNQSEAKQASGKPLPVILDSDMETDVDDAGALAILHAMADQGHARILAVGASSANEWTPLCMDAINTYYGHPDIPIGATKEGRYPYDTTYTKQVAQNFPRSRDWKSGNEAPSAVKLYRSVLARQPDNSVVFISIGPMTNMSNLLKSDPGEHSKLNGVELVRKKVRHWVAMAGVFTNKKGNPAETNVRKSGKKSIKARHAFKNWPTPITFCGMLVGARMNVGSVLKKAPEKNPVRHAWKLYNGLKDKSGFDLVATYYAVKGIDGGEATRYWSVSERGRVKVHDNGGTTFARDSEGTHQYMKIKGKEGQIKKKIEQLLIQPPNSPK